MSRRSSIFLPAGKTLSVTADSLSSGIFYIVPDRTPTIAVAAGATVTVGPFTTDRYYEVVSDVGSMLTATVNLVDFPTAAEALAAATDSFPDFAFPVIGTMPSDMREIFGAGAPVDYTDGTPPATGEGVAGIGSRYTDTTAGKLYINGGTKAQPVWKLVTSAA